VARKSRQGVGQALQRPTLRELEVFRSVIVCGKTTAAAHQLGISQPSVSRALSHLEERRGETLFRREGNRLVPTPEALALNQELEPVFEVLAKIDSPSGAGWRAATIRIFAPATFSQNFLPNAIARYMRAEGGCVVHLEVGSTPAAVASVASGLADVAFTNSSVAHAGVRLEPFRRASACCVVPNGHPLARRKEITPQDLAGEPFIALARRFPSRSVIDRLFQNSGVARRIVAEAATAVCAIALVREGLGVSIMNPFPACTRRDDSLVFVPFLPEIAYVSSVVTPIAQVRPDVRRFVDFVKNIEPEDGYSTRAS
jgi:DNA-binding transcriptional LysR family regulator